MADYSVTGVQSVTVPANSFQGSTVLQLTPTLDGRKEERTETVFVSGAANDAGEVFVRPQAFQIIDAPSINLSVAPTTVSENGGQQNVMVTAELGDPADTPFGNDVVVNLRFLAGAGTDAAIPGRDFVQPTASLTLPANQRSATATVALTPTDDNLFEGPEKIRVTGTTQFIEVQEAELTLTDNETVPEVVLSLSEDVLVESDAAGTAVTVTATLRTAEVTDDVLVTLDLGGSATEGSTADYTASWSPSSQQIRIPAGQTVGTAMVTLAAVQDSTAEGTETIVFEGAARRETAGTSLVLQVATAQLRDDDVRGVIAKPGTLILQEGATGTLALRLATQPTDDVTVSLGAPQGQGVTLSRSDLTFTPMDWSVEQPVTVTTQTDNVVNAMGRRELEITLTVGGADYQGLEPEPVDLQLIDADSPPVLSTADASASEGEAVTFTVARLGVTSSTVTVAYATADDTAVSGTLTFLAGETMKTITVQTTEDEVNEETEVFKLQLNNPTGGASIASGSEEVEGTINDDEAPTVQISGVPAKINSTTALSVTFTFSEDVTGFATGDVTVTGGTKGAFASTNARTYTLVVTPTSGSDVTVTVAANSATDGLNTGPTSAVSATATWDAAVPTVEIGGVPAKINSTTPLSVTFTFSEAVTGFATGDVTVTGGTKGAFASTNARTYTLAVTPTSGSDVTVTVAANSATDGLNTGPAAAVSATATWDAAAPTVGITGVPPKINSTTAFTATFTFSEAVTGFATGDVTVTGGTKGAFAGSGARYTLAVTPTGSADVVVTVAQDAATDGLNTGPAAAVSETATWDAAAPTVGITGVPPKINSTTAFTATFTFSEAVTGFATGDVTVTGGTKGAFAGSGARYTLAVTPTGSADVVVTVAQDAATDGLNTGPAAAVSETATWDAAAPTVGITGVPPKINSTTAFTATFTFSEAVTGFATGDVTVTGGTKGAFAGSGARYTLAVTPTGSADVVVTVAQDAATDGLNTGPAAAVSATATWDAAAPTVGITGVPPKINSTTAFTATFTFSEAVTGFATGDVTVTGGTKGAFAGSGARYTLAVTPTGSADVVVTVAQDAATDGLNTGPAAAVSATATWDAAAPTVGITGVPPKINSTTAFTATFTFSEAVTGFATGDVTVTGGTKGAFAGSGARYTLAVTPTGSADVVVTVAQDAATDGLNTGPAAAVSATATWDAAAPTVGITGVPPKINSTTAFTAT